ncbi:hypothetical protein EYF80_024252 [Liparis tanakae]|uniref:Uncharacterized protein n=1 Tax=Liparis tanakae TaxID=230148 RepID=A0A4Z2HKW3_9TELE|nr:hypothetical protein EYF80_024252 [Liparis tanakae]
MNQTAVFKRFSVADAIGQLGARGQDEDHHGDPSKQPSRETETRHPLLSRRPAPPHTHLGKSPPPRGESVPVSEATHLWLGGGGSHPEVRGAMLPNMRNAAQRQLRYTMKETVAPPEPIITVITLLYIESNASVVREDRFPSWGTGPQQEVDFLSGTY